jgi:hypothetical protein
MIPLSFHKTLRASITKGALLCILAAPSFALAQDSIHDPANYAWQVGAIRHAQQMRAYAHADRGEQPTPPVIPKFEIAFDSFGLIATFQPGGPIVTSQNPFFANLGTNDRTCFSCHQPQNGWTVSAANVQARFYAGFGTDPIFRLVDGATCPTDDPFGRRDCSAMAASGTDLRRAVSITTDPITTAPASPKEARTGDAADAGYGWGPFRLVDW